MRLVRPLRYLAVGAFLGAAAVAHALQGELVISSGLTQPLQLTAPDGDTRLFVVEKGGLVRIIAGGVLQTTPFLDLSAQVATEGERGLAGLAFDPGFASNGRFYVNYSDRSSLSTKVDRYQLSDPTANVATGSSVENLLTIEQPDGSAVHKAGWMGFRPGEGSNLYITSGDGGPGYDPNNNGQNQNVLLGKVLRIDVSADAGYAIPANNPYADGVQGRPEIWASGLRNPFRASFDRETGDFWISDVGQASREEINFEAAGSPGGANYGWRLREGSIPTPGVGGDAEGLTDPVFDYERISEGGLGNSVIGGHVYRGPSVEDADGRYFFGDFVSNRIFSFVLVDGAPSDFREDTLDLLAGTGLSNLASFGEDGFGGLYAIGLNGTIVRAVPEPGQAGLVLAGLAALAWLRRRQAFG